MAHVSVMFVKMATSATQNVSTVSVTSPVQKKVCVINLTEFVSVVMVTAGNVVIDVMRAFSDIRTASRVNAMKAEAYQNHVLQQENVNVCGVSPDKIVSNVVRDFSTFLNVFHVNVILWALME